MATVGVNIISMIAFVWILHLRLNGMPLKKMEQRYYRIVYRHCCSRVG